MERVTQEDWIYDLRVPELAERSSELFYLRLDVTAQPFMGAWPRGYGTSL